MPERRSTRRAWKWASAALCGALVGCHSQSALLEFPVIIEAESDPGEPLADVAITLQGRELGRTDARGSLRLQLSGEPGEVNALNVACPEDYAAPSKPLTVVLRPLVEQDNIPRYHAQCAPVLRSLVVAVRAKNGPDLPLLYQGREIARTDADGVAHALLRVPPSEHLTFVLDTSAPDKMQLQPNSPELTRIMPARDEIMLFDKAFTKLEPKPERQRRSKRGTGGPTPIPFPH